MSLQLLYRVKTMTITQFRVMNPTEPICNGGVGIFQGLMVKQSRPNVCTRIRHTKQLTTYFDSKAQKVVWAICLNKAY